MLDYTFTMPEKLYEEVRSALLQDDGNEHGGFLLARAVKTDDETRLLLREFLSIEPQHILHADPVSMSIDSFAVSRALKHANDTGHCLVFAHSHPNGVNHFSLADDRNDSDLFNSAYIRIDSAGPHGSIVFPRGSDPFARVWLPDRKPVDVKRIRVVGNRLLFFDKETNGNSPAYFDRQILAFGPRAQEILSSLHVAVVGTGGTGSAVFEQLVRLGVGRLSIYDGQKLDPSNVSRVFGSRVTDMGRHKVEILADWAKSIGMGTVISPWPHHITRASTAKSLREADIIFGCTDDEWGRSILNEISIRYFIPVIDMGVKIPSRDGKIHSVCGRVTVLVPGASCLFCRERISSDQIKAESDLAHNPEEAAKLAKEGYAPELDIADPSVVPFTSAMASFAVTELLQRLTGFMGADRKSTEVLHIFDRNETHTNATPAVPTCKCQQPSIQGIGDTRDFLGMLWAREQ